MANLGGFNPETVPEALAIADAFSHSADSYINDPSIEAAWAIKAFEHAETHMNLLVSCDPQFLKLSDHDDAVYAKFREDFPDFQVDIVTEESLKSPEAKEKWRKFMDGFKDDVEDHNIGTLLRLNAHGLYDSDNTILVTKLQYLAVEVARNREGISSRLQKQLCDLYDSAR